MVVWNLLQNGHSVSEYSTIFTGAFLLFQVQPLIGKYILPWFGGGPGVWTTCLLFFQTVLLGGYAYAHASTAWLRLSRQVILHLVVLALVLLAAVEAGAGMINDVFGLRREGALDAAAAAAGVDPGVADQRLVVADAHANLLAEDDRGPDPAALQRRDRKSVV